MSVNVPDIPRIYTALAEWLACMMFALQLKPRLPKKVYIPCAAGGLVVQCLFLSLTDDLPLYLWLPCMIAAAGLMLGLLLLLCEVDLEVGAYLTIRAFITAEFAAALQWQIHCYLWPFDNQILWQRYGLLVVVYGVVIGILSVLENRVNDRQLRMVITGHELTTVMILGVFVFAMSNLSFYVKDSMFSGRYISEIMSLRTLMDGMGVALLYAYHIQRSNDQARKELGAMQTILENQYAQYRLSRDTIDLINRKYHDLKHQIAALRSAQDPAVRDQWLDEMEADIRVYEAQNKTGSSVLDTLLTGKSLYCQKHDIELTVVADGRLLAFMDVMDICTIFGNALDNAIECELKLEQKQERMIHLSLTEQKQFLLIRVENYCPEPPVFRQGLPVTTKEDGENHGFGLKSIQFTARKYDGSTTFRAEDDWFALKVLIPIPKEKT